MWNYWTNYYQGDWWGTSSLQKSMYNYISTSHDRKVHDLDMQVYTSCASAPVLRLVWPVLRAPGGSLCLLCGYSHLLTAGQQSCQDKMTATDTSQQKYRRSRTLACSPCVSASQLLSPLVWGSKTNSWCWCCSKLFNWKCSIQFTHTSASFQQKLFERLYNNN